MGVYAGVTTEYLTQDDTSKIAPALLKYRLWAKSKGATSLGRPTVDFNFADNKSLVDEVSGNSLIDFARSTTATYVDSDGLIKTAAVDTPRFDHDPDTGECRGLLIEEDRINRITYSEDFSQSDWKKYFNSSITSNYATSPDGTQNATRLIFDGTTNGQVVQNLSGLTVGEDYVFSAWIKSDGSSNNNCLLYVNGTSTTIVPTSEWKRFHVVKTATGTGHSPLFLCSSVNSLLVWGVQFEEGSFPTSNIFTNGSQVTRSPDLTEIDGTNFTSWYNSSESTVYSEFNGYIPSGATGAYFGTNVNGWGFYSNTSNIKNKGRTNHAPDRGSFSISNGQISEFRGAISQSDVDGETSYAVNGNMITTDATRTGPYGLPSGNHNGMSVSAADTGSEAQTRGSFVVRRTTYWNRRVTNAVLESLTE